MRVIDWLFLSAVLPTLTACGSAERKETSAITSRRTADSQKDRAANLTDSSATVSLPVPPDSAKVLVRLTLEAFQLGALPMNERGDTLRSTPLLAGKPTVVSPHIVYFAVVEPAPAGSQVELFAQSYPVRPNVNSALVHVGGSVPDRLGQRVTRAGDAGGETWATVRRLADSIVEMSRSR